MTGIDVASDGTLLARSDTPPSLFRWDSAQNKWIGLVLSTSMPAAFVAPLSSVCVGCWAARIAPSQTTTFWMVYASAVFKSTNSGATWTQCTSFTADIGNNDGNDNYRAYNYRMAVDPANPLIVYVGTGGASGLQFTTDGGTTWNGISLASVPASTTAAGILLAYNPANVSGGVTQEIFALSYGNGVYRSTNGGSSWTRLNTAGMPLYATNMIWDAANSKLWVCSQTSGGTGNGLYSWTSGGGWVHVGDGTSDPQSYYLAIDPANANRMVLQGQFGRIVISTNGGVSWSATASDNTTVTTTGDATWMACNLPPVGGWGISPGGTVFDPTQSSLCIQAMGFGMWEFNPFASGSSLTIRARSRGIESLDANVIIHPSGGNIIGGCWDLPDWPNLSVSSYASAYGPPANYNGVSPNYSIPVTRCWSLDYAKNSPSTIVSVIYNHSGKSADGGNTWTDFTDLTPFAGAINGGQIAASTASNYVAWSKSNPFYYTTNSGGFWNLCVFSGGTPTTPSFAQTKAVCADSVTAGTFYIYDAGTGTGFYESTNNGANFAKVSSYTVPNIGPTMAVKAVPGNAQHLMITGGFLDTGGVGSLPIANDFPSISTDGGRTWTPITKLLEVTGFGFGTIAAGQSYPTIYAAGWLASTGKFGVYKCTNFNPASIGSETWTLLKNQGAIDGYPLGYFSCIQDIAGDPSIEGVCSVAFANGGFARFS